jgi:hypothetical protein
MATITKPARLIAAVLIAASGMAWQAAYAADEKTSCHAFVQSFYNWYVAKSNSPATKDTDILEVALKKRSEVFSPDLRKQLQEDFDASVKSPGEIVGLDFDPILNTQSDVGHYTAKKVTSKGKSYLVDVYALNGTKIERVVQPELVQSNGKWQFINFHYNIDNKPDDLLHVLKGLRDDRKKYKN